METLGPPPFRLFMPGNDWCPDARDLTVIATAIANALIEAEFVETRPGGSTGKLLVASCRILPPTHAKGLKMALVAGARDLPERNAAMLDSVKLIKRAVLRNRGLLLLELGHNVVVWPFYGYHDKKALIPKGFSGCTIFCQNTKKMAGRQSKCASVNALTQQRIA
jgi:hypothetical protein